MQLLALPRIERREEVFVGALDDLPKSVQGALTLGGERDEMPPPVGWVPPPLDQSALLELVEQADQMAAVVAQGVRDHRLRLARLLLQEREHGVVRACQSRRLECSPVEVLEHPRQPLEEMRAARHELLRRPRRRPLSLE